MTCECDNCIRWDHESCFDHHPHLGIKMCRACQILDQPYESKTCWGCECSEWNVHYLKKMIQKDLNQPKCPKCSKGIFKIKPQQEEKEMRTERFTIKENNNMNILKSGLNIIEEDGVYYLPDYSPQPVEVVLFTKNRIEIVSISGIEFIDKIGNRITLCKTWHNCFPSPKFYWNDKRNIWQMISYGDVHFCEQADTTIKPGEAQ